MGAGRRLEVTVLEGTPGRPSAVVRSRGRGGGRTLLLCGHVDTVGLEDMTDARVRPVRLHGRSRTANAPGEQIDDVEQEITDLLDACRRLDPAPEAAARTLLVRDPFEIAETVPFVGLVRDAAVEVLERAEERDA